MALAYISVILCWQLTAHVGPRAKLIVKFWYRQSLFEGGCEMKPPVVLVDPLQSFSLGVFVASESSYT